MVCVLPTALTLQFVTHTFQEDHGPTIGMDLVGEMSIELEHKLYPDVCKGSRVFPVQSVVKWFRPD